MADYIYLLETRLSRPQQAALNAVRTIARDHDVTVFLVGGAIRDLISGAPVRDLDVAVQGNALKLKKDLEKADGEFSGENTAMQQLHFRFPGGVRIEVGSTLSTSYPKPGRVVAKPTTILDDLRRRDFTANAMALSLNEGSYGLLMDPLNGVADIENRELRLVSNYGFIEDPVRLIRAARLMARLGWRLDDKTQARYETAKSENYIHALQQGDRAYELEELFHEEDPLRVMHRLEDEGWLQQLSSLLGVSKANAAELNRLKDTQSLLYEQGVLADAAAANFPLLTAKLSAKDVQALKDSFPRKGFVREIESLEPRAKDFAAQLAGRQATAPSQAFQIIANAVPVVALWAAFSSKNATVQAKFKSFYSEWPQNRQRLPYLLMQEMRITPELPGYDELLQKIFFALMDGQLETPEAMRSFLEPYSPPAPPPPVSLRRPRAAKAAKKEGRAAKSKKKPEEPQPTADGVPGEAAQLAEIRQDSQPPASLIGTEVTTGKAPVSAPPPRESRKKETVTKPASAAAKKQAPVSETSGADKASGGKNRPAPPAKVSPARSTVKDVKPAKATPPAKKLATKTAPRPGGAPKSAPAKGSKATKATRGIPSRGARGGNKARAVPSKGARASIAKGKRKASAKPRGPVAKKTTASATRGSAKKRISAKTSRHRR